MVELDRPAAALPVLSPLFWSFPPPLVHAAATTANTSTTTDTRQLRFMTPPSPCSREHHRTGQVPRTIRIQPSRLGERHRRPLHQDELGHGIDRTQAVIDDRRAGRGDVVQQIAARRRRAARPPSACPATLIGPWRYSMAGYDSAHAPLASRILSAASFASPTVHPRPRNTKWSNAPTSIGRSAASARSPSWATGSRSSPRSGPEQRERAGREPRLDDRALVGEAEDDAVVGRAWRPACRRRRRSPPSGRRPTAARAAVPPRSSCRSARSPSPRRRYVRRAPPRRRTRRSRPAPAASRSAA